MFKFTTQIILKKEKWGFLNRYSTVLEYARIRDAGIKFSFILGKIKHLNLSQDSDLLTKANKCNNKFTKSVEGLGTI